MTTKGLSFLKAISWRGNKTRNVSKEIRSHSLFKLIQNRPSVGRPPRASKTRQLSGHYVPPLLAENPCTHEILNNICNTPVVLLVRHF